MSNTSNYKGAYCVYYEYKIAHVTFPSIVYGGSREQCEKYITDYNRMSPEKYRCVMMVGNMHEIQGILKKLHERYGYKKD